MSGLPNNVLAATKIQGVVAAVFLVALPIFIWLFPARDIFDMAAQNVPYHWYEYAIQLFSWSLLPAAWLGIFWLVTRGAERVARHMLGASILGILSTFAAYIGLALEHIDCGNDCAPYIPTNNEILSIVVIIALLWVIWPLVIRHGVRKAR